MPWLRTLSVHTRLLNTGHIYGRLTLFGQFEEKKIQRNFQLSIDTKKKKKTKFALILGPRGKYWQHFLINEQWNYWLFPIFFFFQTFMFQFYLPFLNSEAKDARYNCTGNQPPCAE